VSVLVFLVLMYGGVRLCQRHRMLRLERAATFAPVQSVELPPSIDEFDDVRLLETVQIDLDDGGDDLAIVERSDSPDGATNDSEFEM
jgi:hypothetical protein